MGRLASLKMLSHGLERKVAPGFRSGISPFKFNRDYRQQLLMISYRRAQKFTKRHQLVNRGKFPLQHSLTMLPGSGAQFGQVGEKAERLRIRQRLLVLHGAAVHHVANGKFGDLA